MKGLAISTLQMAIAAFGQQQDSKPKPETKETKIARALSAAPADIASAAKVVELDDKDNETTLREGSNGFTCFPGQLGVVGGEPLCANAPALQWENDKAMTNPSPPTLSRALSTCWQEPRTGVRRTRWQPRVRRLRSHPTG